MALIYTGRAANLVVDGKTYHPGDRVNISKDRAAGLAARSNLHSFETVDGDDILEAATAPPATASRAARTAETPAP